MTIMFTHPPGDTLPALKSKINLAARLVQYGIAADLNEDRTEIGGLLRQNYHAIVDEFYAYLMKIPESERILRGKDLNLLKEYQRHYWISLFSTNLDDAFIDRSIIVGFTHFRIGLPPHLYIAGYTFFLNKLTAAILWNREPERACLLVRQAMALVHLDMSISLAAYFFLGLQTHH